MVESVDDRVVEVVPYDPGWPDQFDRRSHADYDLGPVPQEVADQAIEDAEMVAGIISGWLEQQSR